VVVHMHTHLLLTLQDTHLLSIVTCSSNNPSRVK
jgi:hypothetical protein